MMNHPTKTQTTEPPPTLRRTFCVDEANRALTFVSRVVADVVDLHDEVVHIRRTMERVELGLHGADAKALERDYRAAMERLRLLVRELDLVGVDLQDFERGIITFPTLHAGHDAALSWKLGEDEVRFWHEPDAGFDARLPIAELIQ